jgi:2-phosphoglycerate kinase
MCSSVTHAAFLDELEKIAEQDRKARLKRWAKNTGIIMGGAAAGTGASMLADKAARMMGAKKWQGMSTPAKRNMLGAALGVSVAAGALASRNLAKKRMDADRE